METYRSWYPRNKAPYMIKELKDAAPKQFLGSYKNTPPELLKIFLKVYPPKAKSKIKD